MQLKQSHFLLTMPIETVGDRDAKEGFESYMRKNVHGQAVSGLIPPADGTNQISDCRICSIVHVHEP